MASSLGAGSESSGGDCIMERHGGSKGIRKGHEAKSLWPEERGTGGSDGSLFWWPPSTLLEEK